jgi:hypothetical protein
MLVKNICNIKQKLNNKKYSKSLSNFIIFKQDKNKFQIDYQKILLYRDYRTNAIQKY